MWNANSHQYWDNNKIIHLVRIMKMKYNSFTTSKVLGLDIKGFGYDRKQKNPAGTGLMRGRDPDPGDQEEM